MQKEAAERVIESERISNLGELEELIHKARADILYLKSEWAHCDEKLFEKILDQLDLKLHQMEAFEFRIERRTVIERDHSEGDEAATPLHRMKEEPITVIHGETEITTSKEGISVSAPMIILESGKYHHQP